MNEQAAFRWLREQIESATSRGHANLRVAVIEAVDKREWNAVVPTIQQATNDFGGAVVASFATYIRRSGDAAAAQVALAQWAGFDDAQKDTPTLMGDLEVAIVRSNAPLTIANADALISHCASKNLPQLLEALAVRNVLPSEEVLKKALAHFERECTNSSTIAKLGQALGLVETRRTEQELAQVRPAGISASAPCSGL